MNDNLLDLVKGTPGYRIVAKQQTLLDAESDRFIIKPDLVKGSGEGSRGGHIIGHTSSGKPIYAPKGPLGLHAHHGDHERHRFAAESASAKTRGATRSHHKGKISPSTWTSEAHKQAADAHEHAGAHKKHYSNSGSSWAHEQAGLHAKGHDYRAKEHHKKAAIAHHWEQSKNKDKTKEQRALHAKAGADHAAEYASGGTGNDREQVGALGEKLMAASKRLHPALHEKSMDDNPDLVKGGGPFIGPRGGKWADAKRTIPWKDRDKQPATGGSGFDIFAEIMNMPEPTEAEKDAARREMIHEVVSQVPFHGLGASRRWNFQDSGEGKAGSVTFDLPYRGRAKDKLKGSDPVTVYMDTAMERDVNGVVSRVYTGAGVVSKDGKKIELVSEDRAGGPEHTGFRNMGEALQHQMKVKYQGFTGEERRHWRGSVKSWQRGRGRSYATTKKSIDANLDYDNHIMSFYKG